MVVEMYNAYVFLVFVSRVHKDRQYRSKNLFDHCLEVGISSLHNGGLNKVSPAIVILKNMSDPGKHPSVLTSSAGNDLAVGALAAVVNVALDLVKGRSVDHGRHEVGVLYPGLNMHSKTS